MTDYGPMSEPVAWFRAPYGTLEQNPLFRVTVPQSLEWAVACYTEDQMRAYAAQAVAAERERCAKLCEPTGPRPCDCERCDCGNATDARMVAEWDEAAAMARRIRGA